MEIKVDFTKSAQENASAYYEKSKRLLHKREKIKEVIKDLEARLEEARKNDVVKERKIIKVRSKDWYEKFHWFFTSNGMLAIGGRDAHQNEFLNSRHFSEHDLFFHSDIFGASVVILQGGADAPPEQNRAQVRRSIHRPTAGRGCSCDPVPEKGIDRSDAGR